MPKTFELQEQLNTLPLSNLEDASNNFLNWVEPLLTNEELTKTKENLSDFLENEGPILNKRLKEWSQENKGSWLAPLWKDMYLKLREAPAIDVNYFVKLITSHLKGKYQSTQIASVIISKLMDTYEQIENETFEPETIKGTPLCMAAYKEMFKATSIPRQTCDEYIVKSKTMSSHIVVMYKNIMYKLVITDENGERYPSQMIANSLDELYNLNTKENDLSIGLITTTTRDKAAILLEEILEDSINEQSFEILKDALFMVCMDENSKSLEEFGKTLIGTNENNRYFDKNLQLIFNKNGDFGFNLEHTGADAGPWINVINIVSDELKNIDDYIDNTCKDSIETKKLDWNFSEELKTKLKEVREEHLDKINDLHFEILNLDFGNAKIKSLGYSPDAFLHLALQLAQYRTYKNLKSTYEAVATRGYLNGRTECTRPISNEVLNFVKVFDDKEVSNDELKELMNLACKKHSSRIKECLGSNGVERYFFALKNMYSQFSKELNLKEEPAFFNDEGYQKLTYSFLSTSRIESKNFDLGGFGPVVLDGYGFWYNLLEDQINMNLITRNSENGEDVKSFGENIIKSLNDLSKLAQN